MSGAVRSVKKIFKSIGSIFGGAPRPAMSQADMYRLSSRAGGPPTEAELAEQRAALGASGGRLPEEELRKRMAGTRPLQGGAMSSSFWS